MNKILQKITLTPLAIAAMAAIGITLMQPVTSAQAQMKSGNTSMPLGTTGSVMQGGAMDPKAMKDNHEKMAPMKMTGNADVDFAAMMRIHHLGAIHMAQAELRDGKDPKMKKMAQSIIVAQQKEITQLDNFLAKNGQLADKPNK